MGAKTLRMTLRLAAADLGKAAADSSERWVH